MDRKKFDTFCQRLAIQEQPLAVFYSNEKPSPGVTLEGSGHVCMFALLKRARQKGETVYFDEEHVGCFGGAYYMGFRTTMMPKIEYFLSCGIPGELEGERYVKDPETALKYIASMKPLKAKGKYLVFKPVNKLAEPEEAEIVVFFVPPDVLSGLVVLTSFATKRMDAVRIAFSSGCGSIISNPLKEAAKENPDAIVGMFDVSARPFVEPDILSLAMPKKMFQLLLDNQDDSFLITKSWEKIRSRIAKK